MTQQRKVDFSGVLQQGAGHYLLPPLKGAANQESRTGDIRLQRLPD